MDGDQKSSAQISYYGTLQSRGASGPAALAGRYVLHFAYFWTELRGTPLTTTELRFSFEVTPVTNKTRGKKASSVMPPRPAGGIALPFLYLFPVPACLLCGHLPHSSQGPTGPSSAPTR